jgi:hypothetical protein
LDVKIVGSLFGPSHERTTLAAALYRAAHMTRAEYVLISTQKTTDVISTLFTSAFHSFDKLLCQEKKV